MQVSRILQNLGVAAFLFVSQPLSAQSVIPAKQWDKTFGGSGTEIMGSAISTADGGYLLGGFSDSGISGTRTQAGRGSFDYWTVKLDGAGNVQWDMRFGGNDHDQLTALRQTADGGYLLGGYSRTANASGDKSQGNGSSAPDFWVVKTDASGNKLWDKTLGTSSTEYLAAMAETVDGGYLLAGDSYDQGSQDFQLYKIAATGGYEWQALYGGEGREQLHAMQRTPDGGFLLGGSSNSPASPDKTQPSRGGLDFWIVKTDQLGTRQWDKTYGGTGDDELTALLLMPDGGYLLGGTSTSGAGGDKTQGSRGGQDFWLVKLDAQGTKQWDRRFGGAQDDDLRALQLGPNGSIVVAGSSWSGVFGDRTQPNWGYCDYWILQLDAQGTMLGERRFGGPRQDEVRALLLTPDGGCLLGGDSASDGFGDKSQNAFGQLDYWIVKLAPLAPLATKQAAWASQLIVNPVPARDVLYLTVPSLLKPGPVDVTLSDALGRQVGHSTINLHAGASTQVELPVAQLPAGTYFLRLEAEGELPAVRRIVVH